NRRPSRMICLLETIDGFLFAASRNRKKNCGSLLLSTVVKSVAVSMDMGAHSIRDAVASQHSIEGVSFGASEVNVVRPSWDASASLLSWTNALATCNGAGATKVFLEHDRSSYRGCAKATASGPAGNRSCPDESAAAR